MKRLLLLLFVFVNFLTFGQMPETSDSIYWVPKYCDTSETIDDALNQWIWSGNVGNCIQPSPDLVAAVWPNMWLLDTYECCCQVASLPGSNSSWTGFEGSPCQEYLDSIGFYYTSINENITKELNGIYIDIYGKQHTSQPSGLSIMNSRKYFKIK